MKSSSPSADRALLWEGRNGQDTLPTLVGLIYSSPVLPAGRNIGRWIKKQVWFIINWVLSFRKKISAAFTAKTELNICCFLLFGLSGEYKHCNAFFHWQERQGYFGWNMTQFLQKRKIYHRGSGRYSAELAEKPRPDLAIRLTVAFQSCHLWIPLWDSWYRILL